MRTLLSIEWGREPSLLLSVYHRREVTASERDKTPRANAGGSGGRLPSYASTEAGPYDQQHSQPAPTPGRVGLRQACARERIRRAVARPEAQGASAARVVPAAGGAASDPRLGGWGARRRRPSEVAREARRLSARGHACRGATRPPTRKRGSYVDSEASFTTILPRFSPEKRPRKARGAFSRPSTMVSSRLRRPDLSHPPTSARNSG